MTETLLVIEDQPELSAVLVRHFRAQNWEVVHHSTLVSARQALTRDGVLPLVVLADMNLPDGSSLDLLAEVRQRCPATEWVFLTGFATVADSVRALHLGAYDFLEKPCEDSRLDLVIAGAARSARAQQQLSDYQSSQNRQYTIEAFVGSSAEASEVRSVLRKLAQVSLSALVIDGETGTGKGLVTRILHHSGKRANGPLVEVNCAALPRELLESELFGHEVGAFTGANRRRRGLLQQASGGTLFLDEITEMDLDLQSKLLKVIEDQRVRPLGADREVPVDIQIVAASNRDLSECVAANRFRSDLYHRLAVFNLTLPPLRERKRDLRDLTPRFVAEYNAKAGKVVRDIPDQVWSRFENHDWPGNVRELRNVIERCVLFSDDTVFPLRWLQLPNQASRPDEPKTTDGSIVLPLDGSMSLDEMDQYIVKTALELTDNNLSAAARMLRTTRQTLRYRVRKYGLLVH